MIVSKISHQNILDYIQFLFLKKFLNFMKTEIVSSEKIRNSGIYIYDYAHSFFGEDF